MKIHEKWMVRAITIFGSALLDFWSIFNRFFDPRTNFHKEIHWFCSSIGLSGFVKTKSNVECMFDATWLGFWFRKSKKIKKSRFQVASKNWLVFGSIFYRFGFRFGSQLGSMLRTFFRPKRPRRPSRCSEDDSKSAQAPSKKRPG